jgi:maleylacetate reductase
MHTPVAITEHALAVARERQADCTVALGGGSTTGLVMAIINPFKFDEARDAVPAALVAWLQELNVSRHS